MEQKYCPHITTYEIRAPIYDAVFDFCKECRAILNERKLSELESQVTIPFGKYGGKTIKAVAQHDPRYLKWMYNQPWCKSSMKEIIKLEMKNSA